MKSHVSIIINTPKNFKNFLVHQIVNEIAIAEKKLNIKLSDEEKAFVEKVSLLQLQQKGLDTFGAPWHADEPITIMIRHQENLHYELLSNGTLSSNSADADKIYFHRRLKKWLIDEDKLDDSISLVDLPDIIFTDLSKWARTAAFYAVMSYI